MRLGIYSMPLLTMRHLDYYFFVRSETRSPLWTAVAFPPGKIVVERKEKHVILVASLHWLAFNGFIDFSSSFPFCQNRNWQ